MDLQRPACIYLGRLSLPRQGADRGLPCAPGEGVEKGGRSLSYWLVHGGGYGAIPRHLRTGKGYVPFGLGRLIGANLSFELVPIRDFVRATRKRYDGTEKIRGQRYVDNSGGCSRRRPGSVPDDDGRAGRMRRHGGQRAPRRDGGGTPDGRVRHQDDARRPRAGAGRLPRRAEAASSRAHRAGLHVERPRRGGVRHQAELGGEAPLARPRQARAGGVDRDREDRETLKRKQERYFHPFDRTNDQIVLSDGVHGVPLASNKTV
ncbi:hypothetical protein THAOC_01197 [Thalassiosira oceanica]|uniref:Uncharacterized protein n=1 Tax=Thalassiosira oceanica TaxID=159749 RepID=K0TE55_THAOC|nr:hypothetical protein THAOC_01197 [Thalassiosira oceanica]|eukprot:EJK77003.1 hypothetical protein THAOC_01197 [Thalassiosira oceanica]